MLITPPAIVQKMIHFKKSIREVITICLELKYATSFKMSLTAYPCIARLIARSAAESAAGPLSTSQASCTYNSLMSSRKPQLH